VPDTAPPNDPELAELLLTLDDMPTGWAVDTSGTFGAEDEVEGAGNSNAAADDECSAAITDELFVLDGDVPQAEIAFSAGGRLFDPTTCCTPSSNLIPTTRPQSSSKLLGPA
jgi:hypothetical protein